MTNYLKQYKVINCHTNLHKVYNIQYISHSSLYPNVNMPIFNEFLTHLSIKQLYLKLLCKKKYMKTKQIKTDQRTEGLICIFKSY